MFGDILKKIFGDKEAKDKKIYWPFVEQAIVFEAEIKGLNDDELRAKTNVFKEIIQSDKTILETEIEKLREKADDPETPIELKEDLFEKIDKLEKEIDEQIELSLLNILPEDRKSVV